MTTLKSFGAALGVSVFLACSCRGGIVQTQDFDYTMSGQQDGSYTVVSTFVMDNVVPFYPSDGQLNGFSVDWEITFNVSGIAATQGGVLTETPGGTYYLGGIPYFGYGNAAEGLSNTPGAAFSIAPLAEDISESFAVPDDPELYNPALLAVVTGPSLFSVEWDAPFNIAVYNVSSWTAEASGSVTLTYDYVPEPSAFIPTLGGLAVFGLVGRRRLSRR